MGGESKSDKANDNKEKNGHKHQKKKRLNKRKVVSLSTEEGKDSDPNEEGESGEGCTQVN